MTRVNCVPVQELTVKHLVAEYREITRLPKNLDKSLNRKGKPFDVKEIPSRYTLGKGHVKFFYNKMFWVKKRFETLVKEMLARGYNPQYTDSEIFNVDDQWMGDWEPDSTALFLNRKRIKERLNGSDA